jgi:hypothetical protein
MNESSKCTQFDRESKLWVVFYRRSNIAQRHEASRRLRYRFDGVANQSYMDSKKLVVKDQQTWEKYPRRCMRLLGRTNFLSKSGRCRRLARNNPWDMVISIDGYIAFAVTDRHISGKAIGVNINGMHW